MSAPFLRRVSAAIASVLTFAALSACSSSSRLAAHDSASGHSPVAPASTSPSAQLSLVTGAPSTATSPAAGGVSVTIGQAHPPASTVTLKASKTKLGTVVVDGQGNSLYRFDEDSPAPSKSTCTGACEVTWPPLTVQPNAKVYLSGIETDKVHTVTRPDGSLQLTVGNWPVYYFSGDHHPGDQNGQGVKGTWFAVAPDGKKASTQSTSAASTGGQPVLTLQKSSIGSVVAAGSGKTVYVNKTDASNPSQARCSGACLSDFEPVPAAQGAIAVRGVAASQLGIVRRADGLEQMTLDGFPLYTNNDDKQAGDVNGRRHSGWFTLTLDGQHAGR